MYIDKSSIEMFTNDEKDVFTSLTCPDMEQSGIKLFALRDGTQFSFKRWMLKPI